MRQNPKAWGIICGVAIAVFVGGYLLDVPPIAIVIGLGVVWYALSRWGHRLSG